MATVWQPCSLRNLEPPSGGGPLRRTVELREVQNADLGHRAFLVALRVFTRADLALDLDVGAFGQSGREIRTSSPDNAAVPRRFGIVFSGFAVLPAPLCRQRQDCKGRFVPGVTKLGVFTEESNESGAIVECELAITFLGVRSPGGSWDSAVRCHRSHTECCTNVVPSTSLNVSWIKRGDINNL